VNETLQLNDDSNSEEETKLNRARIDGMHEATKMVIEEIENVMSHCKALGYPMTKEFEMLYNKLGVKVYKHWPRKE
jgi:hypothetical protein